MPKSSDVAAGDQALAQDYNYMRDDVLRQLANSGGTKTISSGVISLSPDSGEGFYIVAAETGTEDVLDSMSGGEAGDIVTLMADSGDTIQIDHNAVSNGFLLDESIYLTGYLAATFWFNGTYWRLLSTSARRIITAQFIIVPGDYDVYAATNLGGWYFEVPEILDGLTVVKARGKFRTAGTTGTSYIDVNKNGSSIMGTRIAIASGSTVNEGTVTAGTTVSEGDVITADADSVATTEPKGFVLTLEFEKR